MHITKKRDLAVAVAVFGFANFIVFLFASQFLGGSASNGFVRTGHHYLGQHGKYTEVSPLVFRYSQIHGYSLFLTHPLALIAIGYAGSLKKKAKN